MNKVKTGIQGLDDALNGGIPEKNVVLISGGAGTGKSTLCMQFAIEGAKTGEKAIYISTEQTLEELQKQAIQYGWDIEGLQKKNLLRVFHVDILKDDSFFDAIIQNIREFEPKRVIVDSLTTFSDFAAVTEFSKQLILKRGMSMQVNQTQVIPATITEKLITKKLLATLIANLRQFPATTILTSELPEKGDTLSSDGISEFLADGVILLYYWEIGEVEERAMKIRKMRYTGHEKKSLLYDLTVKGIEIKND